jgi:ATP-dependent helicase/nuclease subunit B
LSLRYIIGLPGTGKSAICLDEILELDRLGGPPLYYIVPEQYSMQAEKSMVEKSGTLSAVKAQVLSFQRLAFHLFAKTGRPKGAFLDETGKCMLIRRIVMETRARLVYYGKSADKQGFVDELSKLITEFHQCGVTLEDLEGTKKLDASESLRAKLEDLRLIYERYLAIMRDRYFSMDQTLDFIPDKIEGGEFFNNAYVFIDGFHGFTMQERRILEQMMAKAARITVTATVDQSGVSFPGILATDFFYETKVTMNRLTHMATKLGVPIEEPLYLSVPHRFAQMNFFIKNYWVRKVQYTVMQPYSSDNAQGFRVFTSRDSEEEATAAAEIVTDLCKLHGMRYRDIAILCTDLENTERLLKRVFESFEIPLFVDTKTDIMSHPLVECIRAAVDVASKHWTYDSVFRFLRTDMAGIARDDVDLLENYVLAYGVRGRQWQQEEWAKGERLGDILRIKAQVQDALAPFVQGPSRKDTVRGFADKIFAMLDGIKATEILGLKIQDMADKGRNEEARRHSQIWGKVCAVFDKMVEILGDEIVSVAEFAKILDSGLATANMGVIPPSVDQVVVGELARSRMPDVKVMIVLGANDGLMPKPPQEHGFFNDNERIYLNAQGIELAPDSRRKIGEDNFLLYSGLTKPRKMLILSSIQLSGSKSMRPASSLVKIIRMFTEMKVETIDTDHSITLALPMAAKMGSLIKQHLSGEDLEADLLDTYSVLRQNPSTAEILDRLEEFISESGKQKFISEEAASRLYGNKLATTVSRLEKYAECPFGYYLTYNLKAKERKTHTVTALDTGNLFHVVLEKFSENLESEGTNWREVDRDTTSRMVDELVDEMAPDFGANVFSSKARLIYMLGRIKRICKRSIWALSEHIKKGTFEPLGVEVAFKPDTPLNSIEIALNGEKRLSLTGRIDRIDLMDAEGNRYVKIIDYKSGSKKFNLDDVYFGTQLQLMVYLSAFIKNAKEYFGDNAQMETYPGGVFYFNINDPIVPFDNDDKSDPEAMEALEKLILKTFKMSGLVLGESDVILGMDQDIAGESAVIPVSVKTSGDLGARSSVTSYEGFQELQEVVEKRTAEIGNAILTGNIDAKPFKKGEETACDYCLYSAVCGLEISERPNKYNIVKSAKALDAVSIE